MFLFCSTAVLVCMQGRINHCAGCTMRGAPAARGPRSTAKFLPRCFDVGTFSVGLNVSTTTKKVVNFFFFGGGKKIVLPEKKVHATEKIVATHMRKGYVGMGPPNG